METKCQRNQVESIKHRMGYEGLFFMPGVNNGGGLALFWKERGMASLIGF